MMILNVQTCHFDMGGGGGGGRRGAGFEQTMKLGGKNCL